MSRKLDKPRPYVHCGYIRLYLPGGGTILEHRQIMQEHLGRKLKIQEIVHHKNGVKTDNRIENLVIMSRAQHMAEHTEYKGCKNCGDTKRRNITVDLCENCYRRKRRKEKTGTASREEMKMAWGCVRGGGKTVLINSCVLCNLTTHKHVSQGRCRLCYNRIHNQIAYWKPRNNKKYRKLLKLLKFP